MEVKIMKFIYFILAIILNTSAYASSGIFNVSSYPTPADAFIAADLNGGGTVFFDASVTLPSTQVVNNNIKIECSNVGVVISTINTTQDLFKILGTNTSINHCGIAFTGTQGTKTAGYLVNMLGLQSSLLDVTFGPYCFVCVQINNINSSLTDVRFVGNVYGPVAPGLTGAIYCKQGIAHLSGISLYASAAGSEYFFGVSAPNCALDMVNSEIITAKIGLLQAPAPGDNSFVKVTTTYFDNCISYCILIQPNGGPVGYTTLIGNEIGPTNGGTGVQVNSVAQGGHIDTIKLIGNTIFQYGIGGFGINLIGNVDDLIVKDNTVGSNLGKFYAAFDINAGYTGGVTVMGNSFWGAPHSLYLGSILTNSQIKFNRLNGGILSTGGNSPINVSDNLP